MAQLDSHCLKKIGTRPLRPLAGLCRECSAWNMPGGRESTEVLQANQIYVSQYSTQPLDAPPITPRTKGIPVVDRIAPQLSLRAEIIGRNPGDEAWAILLVQQE